MSELQPLPKLQFQVRVVPAIDVGVRGKLEWIELSKLFIDPTYQREILDSGKANIRRMIEGFSWALFGVLVVGKRGGGVYAIIDGQHRATGAQLHGDIDKVPCLVLSGSIEDEARAFAAINGNVTRIHALQSFRASVAAGDAVAISIFALCRRADVKIAPYPKMELSPGETMALGAVKRAILNLGEGNALRALKLLRAAGGDEGLAAAAIGGAVELFAREPELCADPERRGNYLRSKWGGARASDRARGEAPRHLWRQHSAQFRRRASQRPGRRTPPQRRAYGADDGGAMICA